MINTKEEALFCKRMIELAENAYYKGICFYTDFLNLYEFHLFYTLKHELPLVSFEIWGGFESAERKCICFHRTDSYDSPSFPIQVLSIQPVNIKFSDKLTHRDYLGAILNLGIERSKIGDILIEESKSFVFCNTQIAQFLIENLTKVKHTNVICKFDSFDKEQFFPDFQEITGTVSSVRIDSVLSVAFHASRSSLSGLITGRKVFVNGKLIESNSFLLKEGDIVSIRGMGKFMYKETKKQTKKGRLSISVLKYI